MLVFLFMCVEDTKELVDSAHARMILWGRLAVASALQLENIILGEAYSFSWRKDKRQLYYPLSCELQKSNFVPLARMPASISFCCIAVNRKSV